MELLEKEMRKEGKTGKTGKKDKIYNEKGEEVILHECRMGCKRMFNPDAIVKHEQLCQKVFQSKRKAFDSAAYRQTGSESYKQALRKEEKPKPKSEVPKWKVESARLRVGLKEALNLPVSKEEKKLLSS